MNRLAHYEMAFASVGWFVPPYVQMGFLGDLAAQILRQDGLFSHRELETALDSLYGTRALAAMVVGRYPVAPTIADYRETIAEAVEAHFLGLHHVAVAGLVPVIEGAGRELLQQRGQSRRKVREVFRALAEDCKNEAIEKHIGDLGEIASMMDSFSRFTDEVLYANSEEYPFADGTNRHGITHGSYRDSDYGSRLNFYKTIGAVDFLTFVASFRASISWFAPPASSESEQLARFYEHLRAFRRRD